MTTVLTERQERLWKQIKQWKKRIFELEDMLYTEDWSKYRVADLLEEIRSFRELIFDGLTELFKD